MASSVHEIITENMEVEDNTLAVGLPAKIVKTLSPDIYDKNVQWAKKYVQLSEIHKKHFG